MLQVWEMGSKSAFSGEGDQEPDLEPGDIVIVLDEKPHDRFKRRGTDLICKMDIELVEALCGFQKVVETLDKRSLVVTCLPGKEKAIQSNQSASVIDF